MPTKSFESVQKSEIKWRRRGTVVIASASGTEDPSSNPASDYNGDKKALPLPPLRYTKILALVACKYDPPLLAETN
jgi:hypothetical protein